MEIQKLKISEGNRILISSFMNEEYPIEIDFNLLIPVVEKIESLSHPKYKDRFRVKIIDKGCQIDIGTNTQGVEGTFFKYNSLENGKLISTYEIILQFIKWYNENKTK